MTSAEDIGDYLRLEDVPGIARDFYLCLGIHGNGAYPQVKKKAPGFAKRSHSIYSLRDLNPIATSSFETKNCCRRKLSAKNQWQYFSSRFIIWSIILAM